VIVHTQIEGTRLAGNLLGDPTERGLFVYLPPGYDESERRYPTAYLLHAYGETAELMVTRPSMESGGGRRSRTCSIPSSVVWEQHR
jgi:hypothetical protein